MEQVCLRHRYSQCQQRSRPWTRLPSQLYRLFLPYLCRLCSLSNLPSHHRPRPQAYPSQKCRLSNHYHQWHRHNHKSCHQHHLVPCHHILKTQRHLWHCHSQWSVLPATRPRHELGSQAQGGCQMHPDGGRERHVKAGEWFLRFDFYHNGHALCCLFCSKYQKGFKPLACTADITSSFGKIMGDSFTCTLSHYVISHGQGAMSSRNDRVAPTQDCMT